MTTVTTARRSPPPLLPALAWAALLYNLGVILWGAFVRISGSGAGCGDHWPLCNGVVLPQAPEVQTIIELSHRVTSALSGVLAIALLFAAVRLTQRGHPVRTGAAWSLGLIVLEGLVGAVQVRLGLTADSTDPARGLIQGIHLTNTFLLLGALLLTLLWARGGPKLGLTRAELRGRTLAYGGVLLGLGALLLVGMFGAITALGDLLFAPAPGTPLDTVRNDFGLSAHFFERLRVVHPLLAIFTSGYLVWLYTGLKPEGDRAYARALPLLYASVGASLLLGTLNVVLRAPEALQLLHLLLACAMWLASVLLGYLLFRRAPLRGAA